jgi:ferrous iron transport protein A
MIIVVPLSRKRITPYFCLFVFSLNYFTLTIADLKRGQRAKIVGYKTEDLPLKLLEMGCLPGNSVELLQVAPFSDPLYLNLNGTHLAIRKATAQKITVEKE